MNFSNNEEPMMQEFYEEIGLVENPQEHNQIDTPGLSQENVQKLAEDLMNPLPPVGAED